MTAAPVSCVTAGFYCGVGTAFPTQTPCQEGCYGLHGGTYNTSGCAGSCAGPAGRYCPPASTSSGGEPCPDGYVCAGGGGPAMSCAGAAGGRVTFSGGYEVHTFTSSGTIVFAGSVVGIALVVGGGGGGGSNLGACARALPPLCASLRSRKYCSLLLRSERE